MKRAARVAGELIVCGIEGRQAGILLGGDARFVALPERLRPAHYRKLLKKASAT